VRSGHPSDENPFAKKLGVVLRWSALGFLLAGMAYWAGWLRWYVELKQSLLGAALFTFRVAVVDMVTGALLWGVADIVGQYLAKQPPRIDRRQTALVGSFGLAGGLGTHVLLNIPDALLPVLAGTLANQLLRTAVVLIGGLILTLLFTTAESKARKTFRIETYHVPNERWKTADVLLVKFLAAPVKTFIVINVLPISIRVLTEQLWDYFFTITAAYFMNRDEPLIVRPVYAALPGIRRAAPSGDSPKAGPG
jgi:hypothetical protein